MPIFSYKYGWKFNFSYGILYRSSKLFILYFHILSMLFMLSLNFDRISDKMLLYNLTLPNNRNNVIMSTTHWSSSKKRTWYFYSSTVFSFIRRKYMMHHKSKVDRVVSEHQITQKYHQLVYMRLPIKHRNSFTTSALV